MPTVSETWADFVTSLRWEDIPGDVRPYLRLRMIDVLGVGIAALDQASVAALRSAFPVGGAGPAGATLIGQAQAQPAAAAAFFNSTLCHSLDFDDTHYPSVIHPSAVVVPAALACAETSPARGREMLVGLAAAAEVMIRVGMSAPDGFNPRGFGGTSGAGPFGAAAAAARLWGLDREQTVHAFGLAGSFSAGLFQWAEECAWTKRLQVGWATYVGLHAALMARAGCLAPREIMEGRYGYLNAHLGVDRWDLAELTAGLGTQWQIARVNTKPYPCCANLFSFMNAALALRDLHGVRAEDIDAIDCVVPAQQEKSICLPWSDKIAPASEFAAQFSLPFAVATMLNLGRGDLSAFGDAARSDPRTLAIAGRVAYSTFHDAGWPGRQYGEVRIRTRDGRQLVQVEPFSPGSPEKPMGAADIERKFRDNVAPQWDAQRADQILADIAALERDGPVADLTMALR